LSSSSRSSDGRDLSRSGDRGDLSGCGCSGDLSRCGRGLSRCGDRGDLSRTGGTGAVSVCCGELDLLAFGGKASVGSVDVVDALVVDEALVPNGASVVRDDTSRIDGDASARNLGLVTLVLLGSTNLNTSTT